MVGDEDAKSKREYFGGNEGSEGSELRYCNAGIDQSRGELAGNIHGFEPIGKIGFEVSLLERVHCSGRGQAFGDGLREIGHDLASQFGKNFAAQSHDVLVALR